MTKSETPDWEAIDAKLEEFKRYVAETEVWVAEAVEAQRRIEEMAVLLAEKREWGMTQTEMLAFAEFALLRGYE